MNEQKLKELMALAQLSQALEGPQRQQEQQQLAVALQLLDADAKQRSAADSQALEREKMVAAQGLSERELAQRDRLATRQADLDERKLAVGNKQQFIDTLARDQNIALKAKLAAIAQLDPEMAPAVEALHVGQREEAVAKLAPTIRGLYEANKGDVPKLDAALAAVRATTPNSEQFDYQDWEGLNAMLGKPGARPGAAAKSNIGALAGAAGQTYANEFSQLADLISPLTWPFRAAFAKPGETPPVFTAPKVPVSYGPTATEELIGKMFGN